MIGSTEFRYVTSHFVTASRVRGAQPFTYHSKQRTPMDTEDRNSLLSVNSIKTGPDIINSETIKLSGALVYLYTAVSRTGPSRPRSYTPTFAI